MFKHRKKTYAIISIVLCSMMFVVAIQPQPAKAQFIIASWDYPDEYGQGIQQIRVNENSTGSWVLVDTRDYTESHVYDWEVGGSIQLYVWMYLNSTLTGASDLTNGRNYQRCNVTVTSFEETIFSQQNFTFQDENDYAEMYLYEYDVILNFIPEYGQIYTVTVIYEVFY